MASSRILIVEDETITAMDLQAVLTDLGYDAQWIVTSGEEAIETARDIKPDLVLMDIVLKGRMDGIEAAYQIRTRFDIPVVYLTAYQDDTLFERAKRTEPFGYVVKPYAEHDLSRILEIAIHNHAIEKKIREQKKFLNEFLESFPHPIFVVDAHDYTIKVANSAAQAGPLTQKTTCYALTHSRSESCKGMKHPCPVDEVKRTKQQVILEHTHFDKEGNPRIVEVQAFPIFDSEGNVTAVQEFLLDVTDRKKAEDALRVSEEKYRLLVENAKEGVFIVEDGIIRFVNRFVLKQWGYSEKELISKPYTDFIFPDDREMVVQNYLSRSRDEDAPSRYTFRIIGKQGDIRWIEVDPVVITREGNRAILTFATDITDSKQAEKEVRESQEALALRDRVARLFLTVSDDEMYSQVLQVILEVLESKYGVFGYIDENGDMVVPTMTRDVWEECRVQEKTLRFLRDAWGDSTWPRCIREKRPIYSNELSARAPRGHIPMFRHISMPILHKGEAVGLFQVANKETDYDEEDIQKLQTIADYIGPILHARLQREREETRRRRAEKALRKANEELERRVDDRTKRLQKSELRVRSIFHALEESVLVLTPDRVVTNVNPATERMFGYTKEELISDFLTKLHVDSGHYLEFDRRISKAFESKEPAKFEFEMKRKNGEFFPTEHTVSWLRGPDGELVGIVNVTRDVTERKKAEKALQESEERMRLVIESSPVCIGITQRAKWVYVNPATVQMFGYDNPQEMLGLSVGDFFSDDTRTLAIKTATDLLEGKAIVPSIEVTGRKKNGDFFPATLLMTSIEYEGKSSILGFIVDVSKERILRTQLLQAQKMESIGTLAGGIAHDFNNLLTIITGYAELGLVNLQEGDPGYEEFRTVHNAAGRGADLVRQILTFSREVETKPKPINLNHQVEHAEKLLYKTIPKMIRIETHLADDLKVVNADPTQMEQLLINLGVNARDAMPDGGRLIFKTENVILDQLYCDHHVEAQPGPHVLLTVSDTGQGMKKEVVDRIFEPFYSTKKPGEGTGLGLAMVFGIVKSHGGHLSCYSEPGIGTTFKLYFPVHEAVLNPDLSTTIEMEAFGTETLLLVDDEELIRDLGKRILSQRGFTVLTANNGHEALDIYRSNRSSISLVILDLIMPEMGGRECLDELLKIDPNIKVVVSSGFMSNGLTKETVAEKAVGFIDKPFKARRMLRIVRKVLDET
jgi:two-component system cell cycle sensor histidine kinase/response regulator CckA